MYALFCDVEVLPDLLGQRMRSESCLARALALLHEGLVGGNHPLPYCEDHAPLDERAPVEIVLDAASRHHHVADPQVRSQRSGSAYKQYALAAKVFHEARN